MFQSESVILIYFGSILPCNWTPVWSHCYLDQPIETAWGDFQWKISLNFRHWTFKMLFDIWPASYRSDINSNSTVMYSNVSQFQRNWLTFSQLHYCPQSHVYKDWTPDSELIISCCLHPYILMADWLLKPSRSKLMPNWDLGVCKPCADEFSPLRALTVTLWTRKWSINEG